MLEGKYLINHICSRAAGEVSQYSFVNRDITAPFKKRNQAQNLKIIKDTKIFK